ncbi:hypothetical protein TTRE_0000739301 [Trichuris trichiura]|uniref:Uncharacterized protein n=1 Tax=Trichuris trichiura TaxID=36087 RepID=A0A077ZHG0_TRITR|nr:hypothetical protein TTRE_0000739301 [Trichuris trichiura]
MDICFSVLFKSSHIRTIYHICLASVTLLVMNLIIQELITRGSWIAAFIFLPIHFILRFDLPIGSSALIVCEQVAKVWGHALKMKVKNGCPAFKNFIYFLFAPTLIYRNIYPRYSRILVAKHFMEILACVFYSHHLFQNFSRDHVSWSSFLLSAFGCVLPASMCYLLTFYAVLHSWMNAFAEMLRFGDRIILPLWSGKMELHRLRLFDKFNDGICGKNIAKMAVFFLSAVVHEYILTISLRFFYPILFVEFFLGAGIMLLMRSTKGSKWNFCLWLMIMLGNGILYCAYCREWYARACVFSSFPLDEPLRNSYNLRVFNLVLYC